MNAESRMETSKDILRYLTDLRSILLACAIFNFVVMTVVATETRQSCLVHPWHEPYRDLIAPTLVLVSSLSLCVNRWWGYTVALLASGCLIGLFVYLFLIADLITSANSDVLVFWIEHPYFGGFQYLFAMIAFSYSAFSLRRKIVRKNLGPVKS
jgi:hypothetical protein